MADTHLDLNEEFFVTMQVKVKLTRASFYKARTEDEMKHEIATVKKDMKDHLLHKIEGEFYGEELGESKWGYVNYQYEVERAG